MAASATGLLAAPKAGKHSTSNTAEAVIAYLMGIIVRPNLTVPISQEQWGRRPGAKSVSLKDKLHGELDHTIVAGLRTIISADVVGDLPKVRGGKRNVSAGGAPRGPGARREGIQMGRKVKGFRAQLNRPLFGNPKTPRQGQVQLKDTRPLQVVIAQIAVAAEIRTGESRAADP